MLVLLTLLACSDPPAPEPPPPEPSTAAAAERPPAPPAGKIGGAPILERPVVIGAIGAQAVEAVIAENAQAIARCYEDERAKTPGLMGKVLVKFTIDAQGAVTSTGVKSTSLRHPPTEDCLTRQIAAMSFPTPGSGSAYVTYPFSFPSG